MHSDEDKFMVECEFVILTWSVTLLGQLINTLIYTELYSAWQWSKSIYIMTFELIPSCKFRDVDSDNNKITTQPWCLSKTVGNSAGNCYVDGVRKTDILDSDDSKITD